MARASAFHATQRRFIQKPIDADRANIDALPHQMYMQSQTGCFGGLNSNFPKTIGSLRAGRRPLRIVTHGKHEIGKKGSPPDPAPH